MTMNVHVCTLQTGALLKLQAAFSGKYGSWTGPGHDLEAGSKAPSFFPNKKHVTLGALFGWRTRGGLRLSQLVEGST